MPGVVFINTLKALSAASNYTDASAMSSVRLQHQKRTRNNYVCKFYLEKVHCAPADASNVPPAKQRDWIKKQQITCIIYCCQYVNSYYNQGLQNKCAHTHMSIESALSPKAKKVEYADGYIYIIHWAEIVTILENVHGICWASVEPEWLSELCC